MLFNKSRVIVGLTTYYNENLMISMSGMAQLGKHVTIIIHNDNPETKITRRKIRNMGYKGKLYIINSEHNVGLRNARLNIIDFIQQHNIHADWFVFSDDDDILLNVDVPSVGKNHFALIQNMAVIRTRLIDVLRVIKDKNNFFIDNENIYLVRPHVGLAGTMVRTEYVLKMAYVLHKIHPQISDIDESINFRPPVDMMMWSTLNIVARHNNPDATPIYMDTINYIATDIDTTPTKYGMLIQPAKNAHKQIMAVIAKYDAAVRAALVTDATQAGQEENA